jgi:hypothetical protein
MEYRVNEPVPPIDLAGVLGSAVLMTLLLNPIVSHPTPLTPLTSIILGSSRRFGEYAPERPKCQGLWAWAYFVCIRHSAK